MDKNITQERALWYTTLKNKTKQNNKTNMNYKIPFFSRELILPISSNKSKT